MSAIWALTERELRSAFRQPIAWVVLGAFLVLHGIFFAQLMEDYSTRSMQLLSTGSSDADHTLVDRMVRPLLVADSFVLMLLLPALTMRQLADEWKSGTSDLLMTYPLSEAQIVIGKYLGSALVVLIMVLLAGAYPTVAGLWGRIELSVLWAGLLGLLLYALGVLAIGLWTSALTENQVIAFATALMTLLVLMVLGWWGLRVDPPWTGVLRHLSFTGHVGHFGFGELRLSSVVFFLSLIVFFLYLATGALAARRAGRKG
jgi:ABC-2 type transport system permease protein